MKRIDEIRIDMRARNNRLIKLREDMGMNQTAAAAAYGVHLSSLGGLENLKISPALANGRWRPAAAKIAAFHGVDVEWIWPEQMREMKAQMVSRTIGTDKAMEWDGWQASRPMLAAAGSEAVDVIDAALSEVLTDREAAVMRARFKDGKTYEETGIDHYVTRERIRQIEANAIAKLRRSGKLDDYADGVV